eukprot:gene49146-65873_t
MCPSPHWRGPWCSRGCTGGLGSASPWLLVLCSGRCRWRALFIEAVGTLPPARGARIRKQMFCKPGYGRATARFLAACGAPRTGGNSVAPVRVFAGVGRAPGSRSILRPSLRGLRMFPLRTTLGVVSLVLAGLLLAGCSTVKLAYNQAPQLLSWQLNRYLDLTQPQAERVRDELADLHRWHRDTLLPEHAGLLQKLRHQLPAPMSAEQACRAYADLRMRNEPLVEMTQIKGTAETHPSRSTSDARANFVLL